MNTAPYSIASLDATAHEFDLMDLGETKTVFVGGVYTIGAGLPDHAFATHPITREDYDEKFLEKLLEMDPPQRVKELLQYHLEHNINTTGDGRAFLEHFQYVILHRLIKHRAKHPATAAARDWFKHIGEHMVKKERRDRDQFLLAVYDGAMQTTPANPLEAWADVVGVGQDLGFNEVLAWRIAHALIDDHYLSFHGTTRVTMTPAGRRRAEDLHGGPSAQPNHSIINNIQTGDRANILLQHQSPGATQAVNSGDDIEEIRTVTQQLTTALPEIQRQVTLEQFSEITDDLAYIKRKLDIPTASKGLLKTAAEELVKKLVGLGVDVGKKIAAVWLGIHI